MDIDIERVAVETVAFILLISEKQKKIFEDEQLAQRIRTQFFIDYGVRLPEFIVRVSELIEVDKVVVLINEIRADQLSIRFGMMRLVNVTEEIKHLDIDVEILEDKFGQISHWVLPEKKTQLDILGYQTRTASDELYQCIAALLVKHVSEFFGIQETKKMLDQIEVTAPDLLKEVFRNVTVQKISEVLQRLISERISIRNFKLILESLAQWGGREKDVIALVEHVRTTMARYISNKFAVGNKLRVVVISAEMEEEIRKGIRQNSSGYFLNMEPAISEAIIDKFSLFFQTYPIAQKDLIVLTAVDIRRFVKKLLESRFKDLDVISFGELTNSVEVNVLKVM